MVKSLFLSSNDRDFFVNQCICKVECEHKVRKCCDSLEQTPNLLSCLNADSAEDENQSSGEQNDGECLGSSDACRPYQTYEIYDSKSQVDGQISAVVSCIKNSCCDKRKYGKSEVTVCFVCVKSGQGNEQGANNKKPSELCAQTDNFDIEITADTCKCYRQ